MRRADRARLTRHLAVHSSPARRQAVHPSSAVPIGVSIWTCRTSKSWPRPTGSNTGFTAATGPRRPSAGVTSRWTTSPSTSPAGTGRAGRSSTPSGRAASRRCGCRGPGYCCPKGRAGRLGLPRSRPARGSGPGAWVALMDHSLRTSTTSGTSNLRPGTPLLLDRTRGRHGQRCGAETTTTLTAAPFGGRHMAPSRGRRHLNGGGPAQQKHWCGCRHHASRKATHHLSAPRVESCSVSYLVRSSAITRASGGPGLTRITASSSK